MTDACDAPLLLTPGPLTTTLQTKQAMLRDWGSRDENFIEINRRIRAELLTIAEAEDSHVCIPLQGSGTFIIEATLGTLLPADGKALILINGAYGHRMARILDYLGRDYALLETAEDTPIDTKALDRALQDDPAVTHVLAVHCETTSGILNPVETVSEIVARHQRALIIDAMSAFGALPLSAKSVVFDAVMASSNKCLEGVPGIGFALVRKTSLETCQGNAHSLSLDLYDQWEAMEQTQQWRFTPPTHVIAALAQALDQLRQEGGVRARHKRYRENRDVLVKGMRAMGFETLLDDPVQAPIIVTFKVPETPAFDFQTFYDLLKSQGFVIYPGKLTLAPSFRIGCIGALDKIHMALVLKAIGNAIDKMGVAIVPSQVA